MAGTITHVIKNLTSDDLESSYLGNENSANGVPIGSPQTGIVTIERKPGLYWVLISIYCKANGADTLPKLRPYFIDPSLSEILEKLEAEDPNFNAKGDLIYREDKDGNEQKTTNGTAENYILGPVYIGNYDLKLALETCESGADLVIKVERTSIEQLSTY